MNFFRKINKLRVPILWILAIIGVASCSRFADSQPGLTNVMPVPSETAEVAYGASLSDWLEATQDDAVQTDVAQTDVAQTDVAQTDDSTESDNASSVTEEDAGAEVAVADSTVTEDAGAEDAVAEDAGAEDAGEVTASDIGTPVTVNDIVYQEILWDGLIPADYSADSIMAKYQDELALAVDGSAEANALYTKMQEEFNNAPANEVLNETLVRLPGFITPLNYDDDNLITEFLLVPYFGACIHVPAPPANQTVLVKVAEGEGIKTEDSYNPIWIMGKLTTEETTTELAAAGYYMQEATFEPYTNP